MIEPREAEQAVALVAERAREYLAELEERPVRSPTAEESAARFAGPLPEEGDGTLSALTTLLEYGPDAAIASGGPRFFHFVVGGATPAALGADMLASTLDQMAGGWVASPLAAELEVVSLEWLQELFGLPASWGGVLTTGATMANFVGLAAARSWWGEKHGRDVNEEGLAGLPPAPVFSSGYIHASAIKALAMLGVGRGAVRTFSRDTVGRLDEDALEAALRALVAEGDVVEEAKGVRGLTATAPGELAVLVQMREVGLDLVVGELVGGAPIVFGQSHDGPDVGLVGARGEPAQRHVADHAGAELAHGTPPSVDWDGGHSG